MTDRALDFLDAWSIQQEPAQLGRHEAAALAEQWEAEAADNGIPPEELRLAAGGDLAAYLLRTFGEARPER